MAVSSPAKDLCPAPVFELGTDSLQLLGPSLQSEGLLARRGLIPLELGRTCSLHGVWPNQAYTA